MAAKDDIRPPGGLPEELPLDAPTPSAAILRFTAVRNAPQADLISLFGIASAKVCGSRARGLRRSDQFSSGSQIAEKDGDNGHGKAQGGSGIMAHVLSRK
jgi:hypothetical protein